MGSVKGGWKRRKDRKFEGKVYVYIVKETV